MIIGENPYRSDALAVLDLRAWTAKHFPVTPPAKDAVDRLLASGVRRALEIKQDGTGVRVVNAEVLDAARARVAAALRSCFGTPPALPAPTEAQGAAPLSREERIVQRMIRVLAQDWRTTTKKLFAATESKDGTCARIARRRLGIELRLGGFPADRIDTQMWTETCARLGLDVPVPVVSASEPPEVEGPVLSSRATALWEMIAKKPRDQAKAQVWGRCLDAAVEMLLLNPRATNPEIAARTGVDYRSAYAEARYLLGIVAPPGRRGKVTVFEEVWTEACERLGSTARPPAHLLVAAPPEWSARRAQNGARPPRPVRRAGGARNASEAARVAALAAMAPCTPAPVSLLDLLAQAVLPPPPAWLTPEMASAIDGLRALFPAASLLSLTVRREGRFRYRRRPLVRDEVRLAPGSVVGSRARPETPAWAWLTPELGTAIGRVRERFTEGVESIEVTPETLVCGHYQSEEGEGAA